MKKIKSEENFDIITWDQGEQIDLRGYGTIKRLMPVELHIKPDGEKDDKPSYAYVLIDGIGNKYYAEISNRMLTTGLKKAKEPI